MSSGSACWTPDVVLQRRQVQPVLSKCKVLMWCVLLDLQQRSDSSRSHKLQSAAESLLHHRVYFFRTHGADKVLMWGVEADCQRSFNLITASSIYLMIVSAAQLLFFFFSYKTLQRSVGRSLLINSRWWMSAPRPRWFLSDRYMKGRKTIISYHLLNIISMECYQGSREEVLWWTVTSSPPIASHRDERGRKREEGE